MKTALIPISFTLMNAALTLAGLIFECRVRPRKLQFTILYSLTILPAYRGDMEPFLKVVSMP